MIPKYNLDKRISELEEANFDTKEGAILLDKLNSLREQIRKKEEALGLKQAPPLDPSKTYSFEELLKHYQREF